MLSLDRRQKTRIIFVNINTFKGTFEGTFIYSMQLCDFGHKTVITTDVPLASWIVSTHERIQRHFRYSNPQR